MTVLKSVALFILAAVAEIGGAWLVWQSVREAKPWWWAGLGIAALGIYGFVAAFQPDAHFGRVLAAYGGVFIAGSLAWGMLLDGFRAGRAVDPSRRAHFWTVRRRDLPVFRGTAACRTLKACVA